MQKGACSQTIGVKNWRHCKIDVVVYFNIYTWHLQQQMIHMRRRIENDEFLPEDKHRNAKEPMAALEFRR